MLYAFARDNGVPFARYIKKLDKKTKVGGGMSVAGGAPSVAPLG